MDVFGVRDRPIWDYREFTGSFVDIHDTAIREHVDERMANGVLASIFHAAEVSA